MVRLVAGKRNISELPVVGPCGHMTEEGVHGVHAVRCDGAGVPSRGTTSEPECDTPDLIFWRRNWLDRERPPKEIYLVSICDSPWLVFTYQPGGVEGECVRRSMLRLRSMCRDRLCET
jgi:hypothetical protein